MKFRIWELAPDAVNDSSVKGIVNNSILSPAQLVTASYTTLDFENTILDILRVAENIVPMINAMTEGTHFTLSRS